MWTSFEPPFISHGDSKGSFAQISNIPLGCAPYETHFYCILYLIETRKKKEKKFDLNKYPTYLGVGMRICFNRWRRTQHSQFNLIRGISDIRLLLTHRQRRSFHATSIAISWQCTSFYGLAVIPRKPRILEFASTVYAAEAYRDERDAYAHSENHTCLIKITIELRMIIINNNHVKTYACYLTHLDSDQAWRSEVVSVCQAR